MKKVIVFVLVGFILVWSSGTGFAKGGGKGKGGGKEKGTSTTSVERKPRVRRADANRAGGARGKSGNRKRARERVGGKKGAKRGERQRAGRRANEAGEKGKGKGKGRGRSQGKAGGRGHRQQLKALEAKVAREEVKHRVRVARLNRIRELAVQEGKGDTVVRVDKLLEKENSRYQHKQQLFKDMKEKVLQIMERGSGKQVQVQSQESSDKAAPKARRVFGRGGGKGGDRGGKGQKEEEKGSKSNETDKD